MLPGYPAGVARTATVGCLGLFGSKGVEAWPKGRITRLHALWRGGVMRRRGAALILFQVGRSKE